VRRGSGARAPLQRLGRFVYGTGLLLYLGSYLAQIVAPNSEWSTSLVGFTALAGTPLIWLVGIGLGCTQTWLPIAWNRAVYPLVSVTFVAIQPCGVLQARSRPTPSTMSPIVRAAKPTYAR